MKRLKESKNVGGGGSGGAMGFMANNGGIASCL